MTPALVLVLVLVSLAGFSFHALFGRRHADLAFALLWALVGFVAGELMARVAGWHWGQIGQVHAAHGLGCAWLAAGLARRLKR